MSKLHEDTITDKFAEYLRTRGLDIETHLGSSIGGYTPDIIIKDREKSYLCEAEWESSKFEGLIQVDNYSKLPESSGGLLLLYPDFMKKSWEENNFSDIHEYEFKAFFFRRDQKTVPCKLSSPDEFVIWLKKQLKGDEVVDIGEYISTLRELVGLLRQEMPVVESNVSVFHNVLGIQLDLRLLTKIAQYAAAYLLINQLLFYQILSNHKPTKYPSLDEKLITNPYQLSQYFERVLEEDYQAIYSIDVARTLTIKSISKVGTTIRVLRALALEKFRPDIIGKVFHSLIPLDIRKVIAAYYTKEYAADILASYIIRKGTEKVIDLACGSGTLLVSAYKKKASLYKRKDKVEKIHKRFLEEDITGIDIMPFSAHLSTINLALQQPLVETNFISVGILDSLSATPGTIIKPLRDVVPVAQRQQRILDDYDNLDLQMVKEGAISVKFDYKHSFNLQKVDAVIMNPPFTRQESIGKIGLDYKKELLRRFATKSLKIEGDSSYYTFFLVVADKFLNEGGKMALVLPATILSKETDQSIRSFLLQNYKIDSIIIRSDGFNFSENTFLTEILILCSKGKPSRDTLTTYITLKSLDSSSADVVDYVLKSRTLNEEVDNPNFKSMTLRQTELNQTNLFIPISISDNSLTNIWNQIKESNLVCSTKDAQLFLNEGLRSRKGGKYPECGLSGPDTIGLGSRDLWVVQDNTEKHNDKVIKVKHRGSTSEVKIPEFTIPINCVIHGLRNTDNRQCFDVSNVEDMILKETFEDFDQFAIYSDLTHENITDNWKRWVEKRAVNLAVIETLHIEAQNTYFFAYYSDVPRAYSSKFWNVQTHSPQEAKVLTLWFNSSFNIIQLLINRIPTGWFKIRGYVFEVLKVPDFKKIDGKTMNELLELFDDLKDQAFPGIWVQLARNITKEDIPVSEWTLMKRTYENFENELGKGFQARRRIDEIFFKFLRIKIEGSTSQFLSDLYVKLLNEVCLIKLAAAEA